MTTNPIGLLHDRIKSLEQTTNERFNRLETKIDMLLETRAKAAGVKAVLSVICMAVFTIACRLVIK